MQNDTPSERFSETQPLSRQMKLILECAGEGIYGLDKYGKTNFVNPAAERMLGWEAKDLLGKPQHDIIHHSKCDGEHYPVSECPIYAAFTDGKVHRVDHEVFWKRDGTSIPVEYVSTPIRNEKGKLEGAVITFRDISERKKAEADLHKALTEVNNLKQQLQAENLCLKQEISGNHNFSEMIGLSSTLRQAKAQIEQVADTDATVLILGETGVGKELFARAIHDLSSRSSRALIKVNCAALPTTLIESELFGHEKGSFTSAISQRIGRFELANGGTIFLDEIGELPLELQAKLLRVIQEGEFERLGGTKTISTDIRIVAATNRDLYQMVQEDRFREDLYYRLNVFPILVPPLRERTEDIPALLEYFVAKFSKKLGKHIETAKQSSFTKLQNYTWPGNIREFENAVERAVILAKDSSLRLEDSINLRYSTKLSPESISTNPAQSHNQSSLNSNKIKSLREAESEQILLALSETRWKIAGEGGAAQLLEIHPNTLRSRIKKLGIKKS